MRCSAESITTVNSLSLASGLKLLERLRSTLADFGAREAQLTRSLAARRASIARRYGSDSEQVAVEDQLSAVRARFEEEEARQRAAIAGRRARIERLRVQVLRGMPKRARGAREAWLGELQRRLRNAEQRRAGALRAETSSFANQTAHLTAEHERAVRMQAAARSALSGYGGLRLPPAGELPKEGARGDAFLSGCRRRSRRLKRDAGVRTEAFRCPVFFRRFRWPSGSSSAWRSGAGRHGSWG